MGSPRARNSLAYSYASFNSPLDIRYIMGKVRYYRADEDFIADGEPDIFSPFCANQKFFSEKPKHVEGEE